VMRFSAGCSFCNAFDGSCVTHEQMSWRQMPVVSCIDFPENDLAIGSAGD
jgi:hypothetical protein